MVREIREDHYNTCLGQVYCNGLFNVKEIKIKMKKFSYEERNILLSNLEGSTYDVLVIGGGITGAGVALDCVSRGLKVLVVEMQDFAAGTSSRSTKLVHGGLRYLKQLEIKMVADVGKEREIVYLNAPHVTHPEWMLLPIYKKGTFGKYSTSVGLLVYDFLAGVKRHERRKMLTRNETIQKEPLLKQESLLGGGYYVEYRTDDARLTIEVAKKAFEKGADLLNYVKADEMIYTDDGKIRGITVKDQFSETRINIFGKKIVNASGPWVEKVISLDKKIAGKGLLHTKGIHIVIDQQRFPLRQAVYFDTPDGRMVFAIPRDGKTYVGTTDTIFEGDLVNPCIEKNDQEYLIQSIHFMFPDIKVTIDDIESSWAGVRPLIREEGKGPSEISRKDEIWTSETGLITIAGGKLTGYRKMAETITDILCKDLKNEGSIVGHSITKNLKLSGGEFDNPTDYASYTVKKAKDLVDLGLTNKEATKLAAMYGANTDEIILLADKVLKEINLPMVIKLTLQYAIEHEMVITPVDYLLRRTGSILFNVSYVQKWKLEIIEYMTLIMNWDERTKEYMWADLELKIHQATNYSN